MRHMKSLVGLGVVTAAAVAAAAWYQQETDAIPEREALVFPGLLSKVNDATEIKGTSNGESFTLRLVDSAWVMPEKSSYPAHADKVHQLVVGAADLKRLEPKTSNPELYAKLGLDDPTSAESESVQFTFQDASGNTMAAFVLGQDRPARGNPSLTEYYVRLPDDPQTWLVEGKLPRGKRALDWLDKSILSLDRGRIREVRVTHPDAEQVVVRKSEPTQSDYALVGMPENMAIDGQWRVNDIGRGMSDLELDDVRDEADLPQDAASGYVLELVTFDGLKITMRTTTAGEETYARLEAVFDESAVTPESTAKTGADGQDSESETPPASASESEKEKHDPQAVKAEAESLNDRWRGWLYKLPQYKASYFAKRSDDLLKPADPEPAETQDASS